VYFALAAGIYSFTISGLHAGSGASTGTGSDLGCNSMLSTFLFFCADSDYCHEF
jgi:hypothetical protein